MSCSSCCSLSLQLMTLKHSRDQEEEADAVGLMLLARSCYPPKSAIDFWKRFEKVTERQATPPPFLSTHPSSTKRVANLKLLLPRAEEERRQYCTHKH